ncbi:MerR family transcriptional regulator [Solibacillus sp. FSL K6-1523]|uniref:MerR family transcriptional regulator n=1 Tax=Solibacillus sp. FSL K6-1523 TaxID=2921471 RepID=UPI0030FCFF56
MEQHYSIGEIAKITNISVQTLRYYDQIGLFKPSYVDRKTNYRYYKDSQLYYLDIIKSLKYLGTSLDKIKEAQQFTPAQLLTFLEQQESVIEEQINRLVEIQQSLFKSKKQMQEQIAITVFNEVYEKEEDAFRILTIAPERLNASYIPNSYYSSLLKTLEIENTTISSRYGCMYKYAAYEKIEDIMYDHLFTPLLTDRYITNLTPEMDVQTTPKGRYICIAFKFTAPTYLEQYQKLRHYIEENKLSVIPIVYEIFMPTNYAPNETDEFIVELKVKVNIPH